jgi:hypothetical protein
MPFIGRAEQRLLPIAASTSAATARHRARHRERGGSQLLAQLDVPQQ